MIRNILSVVVTLKIIFKYFIGIGVFQKFPKKAFRKKEKLIYDLEKCENCLQCIKTCPIKAISFDESHQRIVINEKNCVHCGFCAEKCKTNALRIDFED
ncbi:MAG: 4Fe-4S binding protein [Alphaproteobacteria bacterium]|nr:4Fe-4S binding protein [Alphaproteobacteria bacterium]